MRASKILRTTVALGAVLSLLAPSSSSAATPGYLAQAGNGRGGEGPVIPGFRMRDMLYDPAGFPIGNIPRLNSRYLAYGTAGNGSVLVTSSPDGITWSTPTQVRIQIGSGPATPLTVGNAGRLAVAYVPGTVLPNGSQFLLVYAPNPLSSTQTTSDPFYGIQINNIRNALSADGTVFRGDAPLTDDESSSSTITRGPGTFSERVLGPTDLIYLGRRGGATNCLAASGVIPAAPFGCDFVMLYETETATGVQHAAIAGGIYFSDIGLTMKGHTAPVLSEGTGWLSGSVDSTHATVLNPAGCVNSATNAGLANASCQVELTVSGGASTSSTICEAAGDRCSVGTARSTVNALSYALDRSVPSIGASMAQALGGSPDTTITNLHRAGLNPSSYYFSTNGSSTATQLAYGIDAPGAGPRVTFTKPLGGKRSSNMGGLEFILNDDVGTNIGIDLSTLRMTVDDTPIPSASAIVPTIVNAITVPGLRVSIDDGPLNLLDGMHTLAVSVKDRDGNLTDAIFEFVTDLRAPTTNITRSAASPLGWPYASIEAEGNAVEPTPGTALKAMRGIVMNPLGQQRTYERGPGTGDVYSGFSFEDVSLDGTTWNWRWAVPVGDPLFYAIPGTYAIRVLAVDAAGNTEGSHPGNTRYFSIL